MKALIIDDEPTIRLTLRHFLTRRGYIVEEAASGNEGLAIARDFLPDIALLDLQLPDMNGEQILPHLVAPEIAARVLIMTAFADFDKAIRSIKLGAEYFFEKPFDLEQVIIILDRVEKQLKIKNDANKYRQLYEQSFSGTTIIGHSPQIIKMQKLIGLLAKNPATTVLISGESGTGKELVATEIHRQSGATGPLVEINSASLSETLLESELFGHEKGAFTDAGKQKTGLFELAADGTIFLDEVAEMPLAIQAKLLKVLDSKRFRRVGGITDITTNARFIGATNRDLEAMVKHGQFREDLYYRINVMPIKTPPLRERQGDVVILAEHFAQQLGTGMGKGEIRVSTEALEILTAYRWPGNIRELKNIIERAVIFAQEHVILPEHLPGDFIKAPALQQIKDSLQKALTLRHVEEQHIRQVLQDTGNNHSRTAAVLGISRSTLLAKLKKVEISVQLPDMS